MSGRGRSSFNKRQKERSRQDKQREKAERRTQRKQDKAARNPEDDFGTNVVVDELDDFTLDLEPSHTFNSE